MNAAEPSRPSGAPKVLYVAGYGRSGSTLLGRLLGQLPGVCSAGELARCTEWLNSDRPCSCGDPIAVCRFWSDVRRRLPVEGGGSRFWGAVIESSAVLLVGFWWIPAAQRRAYASFQRALFEAIACESADVIVVDTSKTAPRRAGRAKALRVLAGLDVRVAHLVRSPQAVRASLEQGTNKELEGRRRKGRRLRRSRALLGWSLANALASMLVRDAPDSRPLRVRYEALLDDPIQALRPLACLLQLSLEPLEEWSHSGREARVSHVAEGNRMRLGPLTLTRNKPPRPTATDRLLGFLLCGWVARRLGYSWDGTNRDGHDRG